MAREADCHQIVSQEVSLNQLARSDIWRTRGEVWWSYPKSKERDLGFFGGTKGEEPKGGANS